MKKRLVSLALAALLLVAVPLSAFATSKFNTSVFDGRDDIISNTDDMTGKITIFPSSDYYGSIYSSFFFRFYRRKCRYCFQRL